MSTGNNILSILLEYSLYIFSLFCNDFSRQKAAKLMNGSSSSRQKDTATSSSQQRYKGRLALKRRAGAAAKAAQKYADFDVRLTAP